MHPADHGEVLRLLSKRNTDIGDHRTRVVCRLHAALTQLAPSEALISLEIPLSQRGNRRLNHAIYLSAVCQIRQPHSDGRAYFDRKVAEGKNKKEALRSLKRQVSNAVYRQLLVDAERAGR